MIVVPSMGEGFGMVALEAMERARPVVAAAIGGLGELVADGETGLLVAPGEAGAARGAISGARRGPRAGGEDGGGGSRRRALRVSRSAARSGRSALYRDASASPLLGPEWPARRRRSSAPPSARRRTPSRAGAAELAVGSPGRPASRVRRVLGELAGSSGGTRRPVIAVRDELRSRTRANRGDRLPANIASSIANPSPPSARDGRRRPNGGRARPRPDAARHEHAVGDAELAPEASGCALGAIAEHDECRAGNGGKRADRDVDALLRRQSRDAEEERRAVLDRERGVRAPRLGQHVEAVMDDVDLLRRQPDSLTEAARPPR